MEETKVLDVNEETVGEVTPIEETKGNSIKKPLLVVAICAIPLAVTGIVKGIGKLAKKAKANKEAREIKDLTAKGYTVIPPDDELFKTVTDENQTK